MALYEVAVLLVPTNAEKKEGAGETLILPPTAVVAADDKTAILIAGSQPAVAGKPADRLKVLVRPFV
jgi:hypothetical protein